MSENWAICVGVNRYDNLQSLEFAEADAAALRDFFAADVGFARVYFFAEGAPPIQTDFGEPIRAVEPGALRRFLRVRFEQPFLKPADNVWFFFAGHGRRDRDRDYLMPSDADPGMSRRPRSLSATSPSGCGVPARRMSSCCSTPAATRGRGTGRGLARRRRWGSSRSPLAARASGRTRSANSGTAPSPTRCCKACGCKARGTARRSSGWINFALWVPDFAPGTGGRANAIHERRADRKAAPDPAAAPRDAGRSSAGQAGRAAGGGERRPDTAEQLWWRVVAVSAADPQAHEAVRRIAVKQAGARGETADRYGGRDAGGPGRRPDAAADPAAVDAAGGAVAAAAAAIAAPVLLRRAPPSRCGTSPSKRSRWTPRGTNPRGPAQRPAFTETARASAWTWSPSRPGC